MSETILRSAPNAIPTQDPTKTLAFELKKAAYQVYLDEHWPEGVPFYMSFCANWNESQTCLDREGTDQEIPLCPTCAAEERMIAEFNALQVWYSVEAPEQAD